MKIRAATDRDLTAIRALHIANWRQSYCDILGAEFLNGPVVEEMERKWTPDRLRRDLVLVAECNGSLAGFVALEPDQANGPYLDNLHVDAAQQGQGIGRGLMAQAVERVIARGGQSLWLKVLVGNDAALRLYERLGGITSAAFDEDLMGRRVTSVTVSWSNLPGLAQKLTQ